MERTAELPGKTLARQAMYRLHHGLQGLLASKGYGRKFCVADKRLARIAVQQGSNLPR